MLKIRKFVSTITLIGLLFGQVAPVRAQLSPPSAPTAPSAPSAPTPPPEPTSPPAPTAPPPPPNPFEPTPTPPPPPSDSQPPAPTSAPQTDPVEETAPTDPESSPVPTPSSSQTSDSSSSPGTGGQTQTGNSGDTNIATGDATNSGTVLAQANTNLADTGPSVSVADSTGPGIQVANTDNGAGSQNTGSILVVDNTSSIQNNSAGVQNQLDLDSSTGQNTGSYNTGGDTNIATGDANVSGTAITAVNTNVDGVLVSEFNIVDDHRGDYVLDFAANCVSGCTTGSTAAQNTGNGANSTNTAEVDQITSDLSFQTNDAAVGNTLVLAADSGNNAASYNTGGDSNVSTGDANVSASALTFANNNLEGNVVYGVVNIYGDLVGDIVFPEEVFSSCCTTGSVSAQNTGNGANSTNTTSLNSTTSDTSVQTNAAVIGNEIDMAATTGDNSTSGNTSGNSAISTGDATTTAQVLNIANSNLEGGNWWLVLVNEAGQWLGQIMGAPGTNYAGSEGTRFVIGPSGEIIAVNSGNGAGSTNTSGVSQSNSTTTVQTNTAVIQNNLQLSANTGGNSANYNTNGDSNIKTGDANIIANIVNFVNNNITGGGKLFVTVVNVFGSWIGDFVGPGQKKNPPAPVQAAIGGSPETALPPVPASEPQSGSSHAASPTVPAPTPAQSSSSTSTSPSSSLSSSLIAGLSLSRTSRHLPTTQVAGYITDLSVDSDSSGLGSSSSVKKTIKINLAWFLLILPPLAILLLLKRRTAAPAS